MPQLWIAALLLISPAPVSFDTTKSSIPVDKILRGGPPKDGIPALLEPRLVPARAATYLKPGDRVIGIARDGAAKAYPLKILNYHEVVNDAIGATPVAVTYCPLTASGIVYGRRVGGRLLSFGVSGRLYQSNVLMYDHQTQSLWSQLKEEAVTGKLTGTRLRALPSVLTTWGAWRRQHPNTLVLSADTGYARDYSRNPYTFYEHSSSLMFPVTGGDPSLPLKSKVFGLAIGGESKAYPLAALQREKNVADQVSGVAVHIAYDAEADSARAIAAGTDLPLPGIVAYWFAWSAFHPDTRVWTAGDNRAAEAR